MTGWAGSSLTSWRLPPLRESIHDHGPVRGLGLVPASILFVPVRAFLILLVGLITGIWIVVGYLNRHLNPSSSHQTIRRHEKHRKQSFIKKAHGSNTGRPSIITPRNAAASVASDPSPPQDLFFGRLPYDIRRQIQFFAFGGHTLHMGLSYGRPIRRSDFHAPAPPPSPSQTSPKKPKKAPQRIMVRSGCVRKFLYWDEWAWHGTVCHRSPPDGTLSHGRLRSWPGQSTSPGHPDRCLQGDGVCQAWPGERPEKCRIGVMGWLCTCRRAFVEGTAILYGQNTMTISTSSLLRGFQNLAAPFITASLTSLELYWRPEMVGLGQGFKGHAELNSEPYPFPIFPSLIHLRICYMTEAVGAPWLNEPANHDKNLASDRWLANSSTAMFDLVVEIIAPPTTNVYVSTPRWHWYSCLDVSLIRDQGMEVTRPQVCTVYGGLKCWRQMSSPNNGANTTTGRGYWFHVPMEAVSQQLVKKDFEHQQLYKLKDYDLSVYLPHWRLMDESADYLPAEET